MDTALQLKKRLRTEKVKDAEIQELLLQSEMVKRLLNQEVRTDTFTGVRKMEFRLLELSEIPYALELPQSQELLECLIKEVDIEDAFSLTGKRDGVLACHLGMMTLIFIRAKRQALADKGIDWILKHQITERGETCLWTGKDLFTRFGGCVGSTPCYDGLIKNMMALSEYQNAFGKRAVIQNKLDLGLKYILEHRGIYHLKNDEQISEDIGKLFYPYPYRTNVLEIMTLLKNEGLLESNELNQMNLYLESKALKAEKIFMPASWTAFDSVGQDSEWLEDVVLALKMETL